MTTVETLLTITRYRRVKRQTCAEDLREGLKLADSLFSKGKWRVVGGWVGGP